ncbi:Voltage-dependent anion-selective channel protein 2 [Trachymyrmex septentrionalis]|uniref:Voltage-dependent anion-selective channel protein 2 n=1 Tax=Trachymyrmex septentrionalis TaxID=34720 RepID=A0A195EVK7_9HYME|nr:PREDICTED: voltage-dependent anion-selective channel protein 2-like [Trachymyrmex septentrionalis]XP_018352184.1 PREDICTED: voltage-dependent anion-selective channel protein 2-like [Trachymyrmex septentrionalis]XP_018352185.1 PREDICTED: voltage-dependent anion-selective channel protein 2-like [Trachymyrmex septentrionalis]KYN32295.1 Voltage-dependent anion-selective channel protein 2 [Trachymyrmex septentrionalis]
MEVPSFADLGKNARDIFKTGYHHGKGLVKFNIKTKVTKKFQLMSDTTLNFEVSKLTGLMETKYKADAGTLLLKWTTDGVLFLGYEFNELLMKGVDLLSECSYNPETAAKSVKVGSKFVSERMNAYCEISNDLDSGTNLLGSVVVKCRDLLLGYQGGYDTASNSITKNDVGVAYGFPDIDLHFRCTSIPHVYGLSVLYKARHDLGIAANGIYAKRGDVQKWTVGAGAKCKLDERSTLRFKFNTDLQLATSLLQKISDGVTLILSFNIDCANVTRGGHRVGLALNVDA